MHRAMACDSFEILAYMVLEQWCDITDRPTDRHGGVGYHNISAFSSKSAGIMNSTK